jgi:hypothetical protein
MILMVERCSGTDLAQARRWYEKQHGPLPDGQELELVCVFDPNDHAPESRSMRYRPNEVFEIEYPWLSSQYQGPAFASYFGTWYGAGSLGEEDTMDFEIFWQVGRDARPLPRWGASWR